MLEGDEDEGQYQQWIGKDFYNPFIKDFVELNKPFDGQLRWHLGNFQYIRAKVLLKIE